MAKIFVSLPVLGKPELKMIKSLYQAILSCKEHQVFLYTNENDSLISRVRNVHVSAFLDEYKDCDYFVSIDSDLEIINAFSTNNIFTKLIEHDKDFVGGLYALKNPSEVKCSSVAKDKREHFDLNSGLVEMSWLSSGCWCIKREAIQRMVDNYPELHYDGDDNMSGKKVYGLYIPYIYEHEENGIKYKKYLSEDWAFSSRWKQMGGEIWADTSIVLRHVGQYPYTLWNFDVVKRKKDDMINEATSKKMPNLSDLPEAGFDLKGIDQ